MLKPNLPAAYKLFHEGSLALAEVECNGARIDTDYLERTLVETKRLIKEKTDEIYALPIGKRWKREFGKDTNLDAGDQLASMLIKEGFELPLTEASEKLPKGHRDIKYKTDVAALQDIDHPIIALHFSLAKLNKIYGTYLKGIKRELTEDGYVHVFFGLTEAITFRSNSQKFNYQNLPMRDPEQMAVVRKAFIPRKGRRLVDLDYGGIEVCVAACYHKDPTMLSYLKDKTKDMHRDMAAQCFCIKPDQVTKTARYGGKNMFVFPEFYGSYFRECAPNLWAYIDRAKLTTVDGTPLKEVLASKGIKKLGATDHGEETRPGTFEHHIKQVEKDFWDRRFPVYRDWKKSWYNSYKANGWFASLTGFKTAAALNRNDVINYPVQGAAFHCLLQSLVWLLKEIRKRKMKTLIIGQVHDCVVADVPDEELEEYLQLAHEIMIHRLREAWKWIIVPLEIEAEVTPVNGSWDLKEKYDLSGIV